MSIAPYDPDQLSAANQNLAASILDYVKKASPNVPRFTDVMIDMEALADTPDSAPAEIGLVFFDRDDAAKAFLKYRYTPSPISAIRLGFNVTPATLHWWDDKGMSIDIQSGEPLPDVLEEIAADITRHAVKGARIWSRGNTYDLSILKLAYHRTGKPLPWDFQKERDVRTWLEGCQFESPRKNDHNAVQDACNQAQDIIEATTAIPEPTPEASTGDWVDFPIQQDFSSHGTPKIIGQVRMSKRRQHSLATIALRQGLSPYLHLMFKTRDDGKEPEIMCSAIGWVRDKITDAIPAPHDPTSAFHRLHSAASACLRCGSAEDHVRSLRTLQDVLNEMIPPQETPDNPCKPLHPVAAADGW